MQQTLCPSTLHPATAAPTSWLGRLFTRLRPQAGDSAVLRPEQLSPHLLRDLGLLDQGQSDQGGDDLLAREQIRFGR